MATTTISPYTNIGPLTTAFEAPSSCEYLSVQIISGVTFIENYRFDWPSVANCYPSGYPLEYNNQDYYSPGICPSGWAIYRETDYITATETTEKCCPRSWTLSGAHCTWNIPALTTTTALVINGEIESGRLYGDNTAGIFTSTDFVMPHATAVMEAIEVRYKAGDFGDQQGPTTQSPQPNNNTSLSNEAKIALGVISLLVLLVGLIAFTLFKLRQERRAERVWDDEIDWSPHMLHEKNKDKIPRIALGKPGGDGDPDKLKLDISTSGTLPTADSDPPHSAPPSQTPLQSTRHLEMEEAHQQTPNADEFDAMTPIPQDATSEGPPPAFSELFPAAAAAARDDDEEELQYRERRLRVRLELLAERERLAREEEELWQLRAKTKAEGSKFGSGSGS